MTLSPLYHLQGWYFVLWRCSKLQTSMSNIKVTQEHLDQMLTKAETQECIFFGKVMYVCYKLRSGFTVEGRCAVVDPANFDYEYGKELCFEDARSKLWMLEGYLLQERYAETLGN